MNYIPITVETYSGYKTDEGPRSFYLESIPFGIEEIMDRWYQVDADPTWPASNYYKVKTAGGAQYILKHEIEKDVWFLVLPS
jgi:hypothetical protein